MFVGALLGLAPGHPVLALGGERAEIKRHAEGAYRALVLPGAVVPEVFLPGARSLQSLGAIDA